MSRAQVLLPEAPIEDLETYRELGGGDGLAAAAELGPASVVEEVLASGLRGRGGAGFPTGYKWSGVRAASGTHRYAVCNAAEGEPATFKDRALLRANPYQVVEGLAIAAFAIETPEAYVAIKESFEAERDALTRAVREMEADGLLGDLSVTLVTGPDEYLFGEEKGLLEVIEDRDPLPRRFPPYIHGLYATAPQMGWDATAPQPGHRHSHESNPTLVNNVETLANVPNVVARGADWFRSFGTDESPGTVVCTVVGDVVKPGVTEVEMGTPLGEVVVGAGGMREGRRLKAVLSGVANPVVPAEEVDVRLTYEAMDALGSGLGAAGFAVYDDTACMVDLAAAVSRFLYVESCNQCPACKLGSGEITQELERLERGEGDDRTMERIGSRLRSVTDGNRCYLPVQEQRVVSSLLTHFPEEFAEHLERPGCHSPRQVQVAKLVDVTETGAVYDERQLRKRPDWTYAPEPHRRDGRQE